MRFVHGQPVLFFSLVFVFCRARDHGIPAYNDARELYGLNPITHWENLTSNVYYQTALSYLYDDDVDSLDAFLGAIIEGVEASQAGLGSGSSNMGPLFAAIMREQLLRSYIGDRLFYRWNQTLVDFVDGTYMSHIIERNLDIVNLSTTGIFSIENTANAVGNLITGDDGSNKVYLMELSDRVLVKLQCHYNCHFSSYFFQINKNKKKMTCTVVTMCCGGK